MPVNLRNKYSCYLHTTNFTVMTIIRPQFITDNNGKKTGVILSTKEFESILEELEELEDIRLYDDAKLQMNLPFL